MPCSINKIDSNITGLAFAEEECLKQLPTTPDWYELEPNSYSDFGGEISTVARSPINPSRQRKKGTVTDLEASGGFNIDLTQNNLTRLMQGFFFASAREKMSTQPLNGTAIAITAVDGTGEDYEAASGLDGFIAGHLVKASGFNTVANNGLKRVTSAGATSLVVAEDLTTEAAPPSSAKLEAVGFQFAADDLAIVASSTSIQLTSTVADFTTLGFIVGEWIFVGGDTAATTFANNSPGYARIKSIAANVIELDDTTWTPVTETTSGGETVQIFFGTVLKNESTSALIVRRTYNLERQLGSDANGVQSEYVVGAIPNELTLTVPTADKVTVDMSFVGMDNEQRDGTTGIKTGNRNSALDEDAFNSSSDIYRSKLNIISSTGVLNPAALFAYISELSITINNGITGNKAIGTLGSFEGTAGDFEVGGSINAYFADVAAVEAVRNNSDVALNLIMAQQNGGMVFDIPLLALSGGRVNVSKDEPVMIPVEQMGAENENGYTMLSNYFAYLPTIAMP